MRAVFLAVLAGSLLVAPTLGVAVELTGVEFLAGKSVTIPFAAQANAPAAVLSSEVVFKHGQSRVKLKYKDLKPAILFGGDVTSYVLWAVTADGRATNLGQVQQSGKASGTETFYVGLKGFSMIVTAEPYYMVTRPSSMVMFVGGSPAKDKSRYAAYDFVDLAMAPAHDNQKIDDLTWDSKESLLLMQAKKAYELAGRYGANRYAADVYAVAGSELRTAEEAKNMQLDNSARNALQVSNTAINISIRKIASYEIAKLIEMRQRELNAANERSETAEMMVGLLANQRARLTATLDDVESENIELQSLLRDALSTIADARIEAAKIVLTLPGVVFDSDKATLKSEAQMGLAKLSGILMVFHRARVVIDGYTDSTGDAKHNLNLSTRRAEAVMNLLADQGVAESRLTAMGYGDEAPITENETEEGRAANRRVELAIIVER